MLPQLAAFRVNQTLLLGHIQRIFVEFVKSRQRIAVNFRAVACHLACILAMLQGVVVFRFAIGQGLASLNIGGREQPFSVFCGQTLCPVGCDPPEEVFELTL